MKDNVDFIIVGSGSAGSVVASRLSENSENKVAVIEFGGSDMSPLIQMPAALSYPMNMKKYDWGYKSEPEEHLGGRRLATPRGKVLGGSSSINGMIYVRGHPKDFDGWNKLGAHGWSYSDVLPYFKRLESWSPSGGSADKSWRGTSGPLKVQQADPKNPLFKAFLEAGKEAGFELSEDYNGEKQEGFSVFDQTIFSGERFSAAKAYLKPALRSRGNIKLLHGQVTRVIIEKGIAKGVEYVKAGRKHIIWASQEVILSASSINSPFILMHSGVGPTDHLSKFGIETVCDLPGVGSNLQDHLELYIQQECKKPISLYKYWNPFSKALIGLKWLIFRTGLGASNQFEAGAFLRSAAGVPYPDIQFHFLPIAIRYDGGLAKGHGFQIHVGPMRSKSRGTVRLKNRDPLSTPEIKFNYMSHESDWEDFRKSIRLVREIFSQKAFDPYRGEEIQPGANVTSDKALNNFIKENVESAYHPCGTCKMGKPNDPMAVVDSECRVLGVGNLRVVDSSIFPTITNGNINAPTIMVGEKASDHILGKNPLPKLNVLPWENKKWKKSNK